MAVSLKDNNVEPALGATPGALRFVIAYLEALLLAVWVGSMIFFSFAVAPSAFAVLPTREMAGVMVTTTISKVEMLGLVIGPLLILMQFVARRDTTSKLIKLMLLVLMTAAAAFSRFWISPRMVSLRAAMGGHIDDVSPSDPLRMQFNGLHQYSVTAMGIAILAGLVVLFLTVRSYARQR